MKNISKAIFDEVSKSNTNKYRNTKKIITEEVSYEEAEEKVNEVPYDNTSEKFCPRCGRTYTQYPALSRYDNETYICSDCGVEEAMINYTKGKLENPNVYTKEEIAETEKKHFDEEVNIENPSVEEINKDTQNIDNSKKKEIEDRIGELKQALSDEAISDDEKEAVENEIKELENMLYGMNESINMKDLKESSNENIFEIVLENNFTKYVVCEWPAKDEETAISEFLEENPKYKDKGHITARKKDEMTESAKMLTEAPEDEEFEVIDKPTEDLTDTEIPIEEPTEEEMSDAEYEDEVEEDKEDTIDDAIEEPFYATTPEFDELRDVLVDLDYRLFLINDNMVCIGRLNGPDIEFLTSNRPDVNNEVKKSEQNDSADDIEERAEENGEDSYEYMWIKAPDTLDKFLNQVNVVYLSPEMSDEDKEQYAGIEASHDSVMNYLMNELPEDKREEHEEEQVEDEIPNDVPMEEPTDEPMEDTSIEEPTEDIPVEDEEEEEE